MRRTASIVIAGIVVFAALAYLRDPAWLAQVDSGLRPWETGVDGTRYRTMGGHGSFFVPATATAVVIPVRISFESGADPVVNATISVDDRLADEFVLRDDSWQRRRLRLPPPGGRHVRRIDIRVDRVRRGNRGAQIGEVIVETRTTDSRN
jgi:hypothetical protein